MRNCYSSRLWNSCVCAKSKKMLCIPRYLMSLSYKTVVIFAVQIINKGGCMAQIERPEGVERVVAEVMLQTVDESLRLHMLALAVGSMADSTSVVEGAGEPNYFRGVMGINDVIDD